MKKHLDQQHYKKIHSALKKIGAVSFDARGKFSKQEKSALTRQFKKYSEFFDKKLRFSGTLIKFPKKLKRRITRLYPNVKKTKTGLIWHEKKATLKIVNGIPTVRTPKKFVDRFGDVHKISEVTFPITKKMLLGSDLLADYLDYIKQLFPDYSYVWQYSNGHTTRSPIDVDKFELYLEIDPDIEFLAELRESFEKIYDECGIDIDELENSEFINYNNTEKNMYFQFAKFHSKIDSRELVGVTVTK